MTESAPTQRKPMQYIQSANEWILTWKLLASYFFHFQSHESIFDIANKWGKKDIYVI